MFLLDSFTLARLAGPNLKSSPGYGLWLGRKSSKKNCMQWTCRSKFSCRRSGKWFQSDLLQIICLRGFANSEAEPQQDRGRCVANGILHLESSILCSQIGVPLTRIRSWTSGEWIFLLSSQVENEVWMNVICNTVIFLSAELVAGLPLRQHESAFF